MNNSKKLFLRIILVAVLFIPAYFAIYNIYIISSDKFTVENISKIEITGLDGQICATYTNSSDIKLYIKTLEDAETVTDTIRNLDIEQPFILTFFKGDRQIKYGMYMSLDANDCIIKTVNGELKHMNDKDAQRILDTNLSDALYPVNRIPVANLIYEGEDPFIIYPSEGEWMLRKNGKFFQSTVPNLLSNSNSARAFQNRPFDIRFNVQPDTLLVDVKDGNVIIYSDIYANFVANFSQDSIKDLQYIFRAEWSQKDDNDYAGKATYVINVRYYVPARFDISQVEAQPGDIVAITAYNMTGDENLVLTTDMGYETKFVQAGNNKVALIPISTDFVGNTYSLTVTSDVNEPVNYYLKINEKETQTKNYSADDKNKDVINNLSKDALAQKQAIYDSIFSITTGNNEKYWTDSFAMPAPGKILTGYGWKVTVNGSGAYINNGVNIDVSADEPIKAANAGKVIYAGEVPNDGKIVVIDHGMGIKTWYAHLGAISVNIGDGVLKGQQIGLGGKSGLYTSLQIHLYFAVSIGNIFVDPVKVVPDKDGKGGIPGIDNMSDGYGNITGDLPQAAAEAPTETTETASENIGGGDTTNAG